MLQQFQYKLTQIIGKANAADILNCLPAGPTRDEDATAGEEFAYSVASGAMPTALLPRHVETASENDPTLRLVRQALTTDDWTQLQGSKGRTVCTWTAYRTRPLS